MVETQEQRIFRGMDARREYFHVVEDVRCGTVSPGGAAMILGVSRQRIWALINKGQVRAWQYFDGSSEIPDMVDVSISDLVEHGLRNGRYPQIYEASLTFGMVRQALQEALSVDEGEQVR